MFPLLRKSGIVDDPRDHWTVFLHNWKYISPNLGQHLLVAPWRVRYQVVQRLVHTANIIRSQTGSHRLDALALPWKQ